LILRGGQAILPVLLFSAAFARADKIDVYIRAEMQRRHIPGVSVAIVQNGRVIKEAQYGQANVESKAPVTAQTAFEIASMTKQFTVAGILLLANDQKLSVDDRIAKYIDGTPDSWRDITLRQLMNHTSGMRDDWDEETPYFLENDSNARFLAALEKAPLKFRPGDGFSYSCGPFLLGLVIEKVSGKSYSDFMRERIFEPLEMRHSYVNGSNSVVARATGYRWVDGKLIAGERISPAAEARGDVGISTTAGDLVKWNSALHQPRFQTMFIPSKLNSGARVPYGLGWFVQPYRGHLLIMHPGGFRTGFTSVIERFPEDGLTIIVLANQKQARARTLGYGIAALLNRDFQPVREMTPAPEPRPARAALVQKTLADIGSGRITQSKFEEMHVPVAFAEAREILSGAGEVTFVGQIVPRRLLNIYGDAIADVRLYRVRIGAQDMFWSASFTRDGKIDFLDYEEE